MRGGTRKEDYDYILLLRTRAYGHPTTFPRNGSILRGLRFAIIVQPHIYERARLSALGTEHLSGDETVNHSSQSQRHIEVVIVLIKATHQTKQHETTLYFYSIAGRGV